MQNDNSAPLNNEVTADAIKGTTKAKQTPLVPTPLAKLAIQGAKGIHDLKADHEIVDVLLHAVLGYLPVKQGEETEEEAAERIAMALAQAPSVRAAVVALESARAKRKKDAKLAKLKAMMAELEDRTDALEESAE